MPTPNFPPNPSHILIHLDFPWRRIIPEKSTISEPYAGTQRRFQPWFTRVQKTGNECGVLDKDIYKFDETGFQMCVAKTSHQSHFKTQSHNITSRLPGKCLIHQDIRPRRDWASGQLHHLVSNLVRHARGATDHDTDRPVVRLGLGCERCVENPLQS